jgi:hypothetical protein
VKWRCGNVEMCNVINVRLGSEGGGGRYHEWDGEIGGDWRVEKNELNNI